MPELCDEGTEVLVFVREFKEREEVINEVTEVTLASTRGRVDDPENRDKEWGDMGTWVLGWALGPDI